MKNTSEPTKQDQIIINQADALSSADIDRTPKTVAEFLDYYFINLGHDTQDFQNDLVEAVEGLSQFCYDSESE